jgi:hypothetical protein
MRTWSIGSSIPCAPAIKQCPNCREDRINLNQRSSYGIGFSGRLTCARCIQQEHRDVAAAEKTTV